MSLEPDTNALVRRLMRERGLTFKQALNEAIRAGAGSRGAVAPYQTRTADMGRAAIPLDKALRVAAEIEDDELTRRLVLRK